jgi:mutator protein MutT
MDYEQTYDDGTIKISRSKHGWHLWARPAVTTLLVKNSEIIVIHEQKNSTKRWIYNCPGGMIEPGETSKQAAARECEEEVGLVPRKLEKFATIQTDFPDTFVDFYIGSDIISGTKADWVEENIDKIEWHSWPDIYQMAVNTDFGDPRLVTALLQLAKQDSLLKAHALI